MKKFNLFDDETGRLPYDFAVETETHAHGEVTASCPSIPGARAQGKNEKEALERLRAWLDRYFTSAVPAPFERTELFPDHPKLYSLIEFRGHLLASTNRDSVLKSGSGSAGSWKAFPVTRTNTKFFNPSPGAGQQPLSSLNPTESSAPTEDEAGDYVTQVYCLARYAPLGQEAGLFAGTNLNGSVFRSDDGETWREAFATGEDRVHCLCVFKDKLYAGTSSGGRIFAYDGAQWNAVGALNEVAVTALGVFNQKLWAGTYPSGLLFSSANGFAWEEVAGTGHHFVQCFKEFKGAFYVGCSSPRGAAILRTLNGKDWETVYENARELNVFTLESFDGRLWAGTGNSGRVLSTLDGADWTTAYAGDHESVRSFAPYRDFLWAATENGGSILKSTRDAAQLPKIERVTVSDVTSSSAVVTWETDLNAGSEVQYGALGMDADSPADETHPDFPLSAQDRTPKRQHRLKLAGLKSGTEYLFRVISANRQSSMTVLDGQSFRTASVSRPKVDSPTHPDNGQWSRMDSPELILFSEGRVAGWRWRLDREPLTFPDRPQAEFTEANRVALTRLAQGRWWFHVASVDENGNPGEEAVHFPLFIDTQAEPPENIRSSTHPKDGAWVSNPAPVIEWDAPEDLSGVKGYYVRVDREPVGVPGPQDGVFTTQTRFEPGPLEDGIWHAHVTTVDEAGNVGAEAAHLAVRIDTQAVAPSLTSPTHPREDRWYPVKDCRVDWAPPHDLSGVAGFLWVLDQEPLTLPEEDGEFCTQPHLAFENLNEGLWFLHVRTQDQAGNLSRESSHLAIRVDTQADPPWVESPTHPEEHHWYNKRRVTATWKDPQDESGVDGYYYLIDQEPATVPSSATGIPTQERSLSFEVQKDGLWYLHLVTQDKAGNVGKRAAHLSARVDTQVDQPGILSRTHPDPNQWSNRNLVKFEFQAPPDLSGISAFHWHVAPDGDETFDLKKAQRTVNPAGEVQLHQDGVYSILAVCEDGAGNLSRVPGRFKVRLVTQVPPPILQSPSHPEPTRWYSQRRLEASLGAPPSHADVEGYYTVFNQEEHWKLDLTAMRYSQAPDSLATATADGVWWCHAVSRDKAGNHSQTASRFAFRVDTEAMPPVVDSSTHPDPQRWFNKRRVSVSWRDPADLSGVAGYFYNIDREPGTVPTAAEGLYTRERALSFEVQEDGVWYFHIVTQDQAGNVGVQATHFTVQVDTHVDAPILSSPSHPDPKKWSNQARVRIAFAPPADLSGVAAYLYHLSEDENGAFDPRKARRTADQAVEIQLPHDGVHHILAICEDQAGNLGAAPARIKVRLAQGLGQPTLKSPTHPDASQWYPGRRFEAFLTDPECLAGVEGYYVLFNRDENWKFDPAAMRYTQSRGTAVEVPVDGIWWLHVVARDQAGNLGTPGKFRFQVDSAAFPPPVTSPTHPPQRWSHEVRAKFAWTAPPELSGVAGYYILLDRKPQTVPTPQTGTWITEPSWTSEPLEDGTWYFHVTLKDKVGNVSQAATHYAIQVDCVAPVTRLKPLPECQDKTKISLAWESTDDSSGVDSWDLQARENNGPWLDIQTGLTEPHATFQGKDGSTHFFRVRARDKVGNLEAFTETGDNVASITVDISPPPPVPELTATSRPKGDVQLAWKTVTDPVSGTAYYRVYRWVEGEKKVCVSRDGDVKEGTYLDPAAGLRENVVYHYCVQPLDRLANEQHEGNATATCMSDRGVGVPAVTSPTHPADQWSPNGSPAFTWLAPPDATGVDGYFYLFDREPASVPGPERGEFTKDLKVQLKDVAAGRWWFHLVARDRAGNLSPEPARFALLIDPDPCPPPKVECPTHPDPAKWYDAVEARFTFQAVPKASGLEAFYYHFDRASGTSAAVEGSLRTTETEIKVIASQPGQWWLHAAARDQAGHLSGTVHLPVRSLGGESAPPVVHSPTHASETEPSSDANPVFTWEDRVTGDAPPTYVYRLSQKETETLTADDQRTQDRTVKFANIGDGAWYFHVTTLQAGERAGVLSGRRRIVIKKVGKVAGRFMSKDGLSPMQAIPVEAWRAGKREAVTTTGPDGIFVFEALPEGRYDLRLQAPNLPYLPLKDIHIGPGLTPPPMILSDDAGVFPNPPPPGPVTFYYFLKEDCQVLIEIYDDKGNLVDKVGDKKPGGAYALTIWDATGRREGIYQYKLTCKSLTRNALSRFTVKKFKLGRLGGAKPSTAPIQSPKN